jgi:hypothetical protein
MIGGTASRLANDEMPRSAPFLNRGGLLFTRRAGLPYAGGHAFDLEATGLWGRSGSQLRLCLTTSLYYRRLRHWPGVTDTGDLRRTASLIRSSTSWDQRRDSADTRTTKLFITTSGICPCPVPQFTAGAAACEDPAGPSTCTGDHYVSSRSPTSPTQLTRTVDVPEAAASSSDVVRHRGD